jgi:hypothetical protein
MKYKMTDIMIDLETLNTTPDSIILTIGAVKFDRTPEITELKNCDTFYRRVDINSCKDAGLTSSNETIKWWNSQDEVVRMEALGDGNRFPLENVLIDFKNWIGGNNKKIWAHGDDFDCVILDNAYRIFNIKKPWAFWNTRDTRTLFDIANININSVPVCEAHNSLHDAYRQVLAVKLAFSKIKKN